MKLINLDEIEWHELELPFSHEDTEPFAYKSELVWATPAQCATCQYYKPYEIVPHQGSCQYITKSFLKEDFFCGFYRPNEPSHYTAFWEDTVQLDETPREPDKD